MAKRDEATREFVDALRELSVAAQENIDRWQLVKVRSDHLLSELAGGASLVELVEAEQRPRIVELITENIANLETVGGAVRRSQAEALRAHGLTLAAIGDLFGVSRQRVSELLNSNSNG